MAHEVDTLMTVRTPAWHGLGAVLEDNPRTWVDARIAAGLMWEPIETSGYVGLPRIGDAGPYTEYVELPDHKIIVRDDTGAVLGPAKNSFSLISHSSMGLILDKILENDAYVFDAAGSLQGGKKVFAVLELGDPIQIKGDPSPTRRYVVMLNAHDGSSACRVIATMIRVVCMNTWRAADAISGQDGTAYNFRHTSGWETKLEEVAKEARAAITGSQAQVELYRAQCDAMTDMQVSSEQAARFVQEFVYPTKEEHKLTPGPKGSHKNVVAGRLALQEILDGPTSEGLGMTAYTLLQAGGEWADRVRPYKTNGSLFGRAVMRPDNVKENARTLAMAAAAGTL